MIKTNVMRILDKANLTYGTASYDYDESDLSGVHAAQSMNLPVEQVFKTLLTKGDKTGLLVFCIPVSEELDLKKAATLSGNKKLVMVPVKSLLELTGYVRGGCSPIGMKKKYPTSFHQSALDLSIIAVSAGMRGQQIMLSPTSLIDLLDAKVSDIISKQE